MPATSDGKLPAYRRNPLAFGAVVLVALLLIAITVGLVNRHTGWLRIPGAKPSQVPFPSVSGGYVTALPGTPPIGSLRPTRVMTDQERLAELARCRPLLDMRNAAAPEARQTCRDILKAVTARP